MRNLLTQPRSQTVYAPGGATSTTPPSTKLVQKGKVALVAGTQSYNIVFSPAFATVPTSFLADVQMVNSTGEAFDVMADLSTLTTAGVTVWLSAVPTALSTGAFINWRAEL